MLTGERLLDLERGMTHVECLITLLLMSAISTGIALFFCRMGHNLREMGTQEAPPCETPICTETPSYLQCSCGGASWTVYV